MDFENCTTASKNKIIPLKENKSSLVIKNPKEYRVNKIQVDGCLIGEGEEKCDWLIEFDMEEVGHAYFVELKGCDLDKAVSQIESTIRKTKSVYARHEKKAFIVCSRVPKHGPSVRKKSMVFQRKTGASLYIKSLKSEVVI